MTQKLYRLQIQQDYAVQLLAEITEEYSVLKPEMQQISKQYPGSDDEFSFLEEFELWIASICGYAKQIQTTGRVKQFDSAINHLQTLQVFANPIFARFYFEAKQTFPKIHSYLQRLDYLRLLTLEYLQMQQLLQPVSA